MKDSINYVVIDESFPAEDVVGKYIDEVPYLLPVGRFDSAVKSINRIAALKPDVIFFYTDTSVTTGIELLSSFTHRPYIIIITANPQSAIDAFESGANNFLLKPLSFFRFMKVVCRISEGMLSKTKLPRKHSLTIKAPPTDGEQEQNENKDREFFMVREDKKLVKVNIKDIVFIEGMKDYIKIHLTDRFIVAHATMCKLLDLLPPNKFMRINRSYIVQVSHIIVIDGNTVVVQQGKKLPIGTNYRELVKEIMQKWVL